MSSESAKAFIKKMKPDEEFAKKVAGYKDLKTVQEFEQATSELTDDDLDQIAGGVQPHVPKNAAFT